MSRQTTNARFYPHGAISRATARSGLCAACTDLFASSPFRVQGCATSRVEPRLQSHVSIIFGCVVTQWSNGGRLSRSYAHAREPRHAATFTWLRSEGAICVLSLSSIYSEGLKVHGQIDTTFRFCSYASHYLRQGYRRVR